MRFRSPLGSLDEVNIRRKPAMRYFDRDQTILDIARGKKVLHLGCVGFADLPVGDRILLAKKSLHWALTEVADVVGIDYSAHVVEEYRKNGVFNNVVVGNVERLEELDLRGTFDVIVAGDIIEHLSNPGLMLDGIQKFARPDGKLVLTTPHAFGLPNYVRFVFNRFKEGAEHVLAFNAENLTHLLHRHGYRVEELDTCYQRHAREHGAAFVIGRSVLTRFPKFGGTLFVVARPQP